jgi:hypothetical protein
MTLYERSIYEVNTTASMNGHDPGSGPGLFEHVSASGDGHVHRYVTNVRRLAGTERKPGTVLLVVASGLLLLLAAAQGYVSWRAQFMFVNKAKHAPLAAGLEALGLDVAAVIFALLGLAHARMGKPARVERILNVSCAFGSMVMNLLAANLGSPRSVAVYVLPPLLYAACSDRLIAVAGSLGGVREAGTWRAVAGAAPYVLRLVLAPPSTALGLRRWVLAATPLPAAPAAQEETREIMPAIMPVSPAAGTLVAGDTARPHSIDGAAQAAVFFAAELAAGKVPSIRRIRDHLGCGQARAAAVQEALRAEVTS